MGHGVVVLSTHALIVPEVSLERSIEYLKRKRHLMQKNEINSSELHLLKTLKNRQN